jgi:hypothetical protein
VASHQQTTFVLSVLATFLLWTLASGARAQPEAIPTSAGKTAPTATSAGSPSSGRTPAQDNALQADGDLKFVVALFRHGVRAPLEAFGDSANKYSGSPWPRREDWGAIDNQWGYLTRHGGDAVGVLGVSYGSYYSKAWGKGFKAFLWADVDERTEKTAAALKTGMGMSGASVTVASLYPEKADPLFHPFLANCGTPSQTELDRITNHIKAGCREWLCLSKDQFTNLDDVLACQNERVNTACEPLGCVGETVSAWASPTPRPSSPIKWDGQFSYASSATEAFLLEYANGMDPGWGRMEVGQAGSRPRLSELLRLHEFYFDNTERDPYLAGIGGANLVREILSQLNRKAGRKSPLDGTCPRGDVDSQFVGLVGHDTNLANLNTLLKVRWKFDDPQLPDDTRNLPENDALPAGALVFELRGGSPDYRVRIQYVTQSLGEIRNAPQPGDPYRVPTTCGNNSGPCEMSLGEFNKIAGEVIKNYGPFLSNCQNGKQTCP